MLKIMTRLVARTGKYKSRIRWSYLTSVIKGIMLKVPMMLSFLVINEFIQGTMNKDKCLYFGIAIVVSIVIEALFEHITNVLTSATGYMVFADMRMELGNHLRKLPMGYFTEGNLGRISAVLSTDMVFIEENCMAFLGELISFLISQTLMIAMIFWMDIRIGVLSIIVVGAIVVIGKLMMKTTLEHSATIQECAKKLTDAVLDFAEGIGIIKSYNMLGERSKKLSDNFKESCENSIEFELDYSPWARALWITHGIGTAIVVGAAAYLTMNGEIPYVYMLGILLFALDLFVPIKSFYGQIARLTVTSACLDRIDNLFKATELDDNGVLTIPESSGSADCEIEYDNVTFGYTDTDVLKNISFKVNKGEMVALVGPSGGGKSTIASLLTRFWDVDTGVIKVRGQNIKDVPVGNLMDNISVVFQRVYLFNDTIYNNIAMARPNATKEEVYEAARKARCYDFIMNLPNGFDTVLEEGGGSLSGGEKQRISIARCILKDSPIVILDEATASVDADNERAIQEAISELCKEKTLLVIAHRLKTIQNADKILVINEGRIQEEGNSDVLIKSNGMYAKMVSLQEKAFA